MKVEIKEVRVGFREDNEHDDEKTQPAMDEGLPGVLRTRSRYKLYRESYHSGRVSKCRERG